MTAKIAIPIFGFLITLISVLSAQTELKNAFPNLSFHRPVDLQHSGDGNDLIFVVEQPGVIWVFQNDSEVTQKVKFLDIQDRVNDGGFEEGLLGLAFHPDYENNGYFYVNYTASGPRRTIVSRFSVSPQNPDSADKNSEFQISTYSQPFSNHNGGQVLFGPDGYLYIAVGDGGDFGDPDCNAQDLQTLLGSVLRVDVDTTIGNQHYGIPPHNPFVGNTQGYREEIYAYGLRNPWRISLDPVTGWLWAGDVGQDDYEEIDIIKPGENYGWSIFEGFHCYNSPWPCQTEPCDTMGKAMPVWEYSHSLGYSVTGGYVYRGPTVPELEGKYIYGDWGSGRIWSLEYDGVNPPNITLLMNTSMSISSFGVDQHNELYICDHSFTGSTSIYRFKPTITKTGKSNIEKPKSFKLGQNYPNPFNPETTIPFRVEQPGKVQIRIFDVNGKLIGTLLNERMNPGEHQIEWDGTGDNGKLQSSGIYYYKISVDNRFSEIKKMALIK